MSRLFTIKQLMTPVQCYGGDRQLAPHYGHFVLHVKFSYVAARQHEIARCADACPFSAIVWD